MVSNMSSMCQSECSLEDRTQLSSQILMILLSSPLLKKVGQVCLVSLGPRVDDKQSSEFGCVHYKNWLQDGLR